MNQTLSLALLAASLVSVSAAQTEDASRGVRILQRSDHLRVELNGKMFTCYWFTNIPRPFCYPVLGPGEKLMTRNYPMVSPANEEQDHPHHRSVWFTHGAVNGHDFWSEQKGHGKVVHVRFDEIRSGGTGGRLRSHNQWISREGKVICTDDRVIKFYPPAADDSRIMDWEVTLHASHGEVVLGDTKEGSMAIRLAESMRVKQPNGPGKGRIVTSEGKTDDDAWGTRAPWCDYSGPVDALLLGVAMFDHPDNPRHPTWWHVREYGLFAANPFGVHDFEKAKEKTAGDLKIPAGRSATFRYRLYFHSGNEKNAQVQKHFDSYAKRQQPKKPGNLKQ